MSVIQLSDSERGALLFVMEARWENVVECREETGDDEYDQTDEDQCSVLVFMLSDLDVDPSTVASMGHLYDAIWIAEDTPDAFPDVDFDSLRSASVKVGYPGRCPGCWQDITVTDGKTECGGEGEGICCVVANDDEPCTFHPDGHTPEAVAEARAAHVAALHTWETTQ